MKLYLATTSKFKSSILNKTKVKHTCIKNTFDENLKISNPYQLVMALSKGKANNTPKSFNDGIIIGLDTIVYLNNKIYGKPKDIEEAKNNLKKCSNQTIKVITGITLNNKITNTVCTDYQETTITFSEISQQDIQYYIENEPDVMYASGFVIETVASCFIKKVEGSFYNILGMPVEKIYSMLNKMGYALKDFD